MNLDRLYVIENVLIRVCRHISNKINAQTICQHQSATVSYPSKSDQNRKNLERHKIRVKRHIFKCQTLIQNFNFKYLSIEVLRLFQMADKQFLLLGFNRIHDESTCISILVI